MAKQPAVRASAVHDALSYLDKFQVGARERVLARVPPVSRAIIEGTSRSAWIHVEHDKFTIDAIVGLFGAARAVEYWAGTLTTLVDKPLLRSFVSGMLSIIHLEPARLVSIFATGWALVYRDMCELSISTGANGNVLLRFDAIAPEVRACRNYLLSWQGGCVGFSRLANIPGRVQFRSAPDASWAEAEFVTNDAALPSAPPLRFP